MTEKNITLLTLKKQIVKKVINRKDLQIITKYQNGQHHWTKRADLCRIETSLW